jgi:hypothetical protein
MRIVTNSPAKAGQNQASGIDLANFKVYPNPARDLLFIESEKTIQIYNATGALMYEGKSGVLDVGEWTSGLYIVRSGNAMERILIQR